MPPSRCREKKSGVIEHSPAPRLRPPPPKEQQLRAQRALSRAGSRYYAAVPRLSFLPSFLSLPNDVFPAIGFPREQWLGGWTRGPEDEREKREGGEA